MNPSLESTVWSPCTPLRLLALCLLLFTDPTGNGFSYQLLQPLLCQEQFSLLIHLCGPYYSVSFSSLIRPGNLLIRLGNPLATLRQRKESRSNRLNEGDEVQGGATVCKVTEYTLGGDRL